MLQNKTILVVEDEKKIAKAIAAYLEAENCRAICAFNGEQAIESFKNDSVDLIILDIMIPKLNGIEVLKKVRAGSDVPVVMLTAKSEEVDKVLGLELGADDYVTKPFSPRELIARIKAILRRRAGQSAPDQEIKQGPLVINVARHEAKYDGKLLSLTATEFELLSVMAKSPGRVFSRLQLLKMLQEDFYEGYERTIDVHIKNIRHKLENNDGSNLIKTVHGVGYKFEVDDEA
ncbi:MAG: DNA-binding response regulator [Actinobacteria bacterium]|nr:MAG: DNA-binding response regulator [Actinomycetota bacterium]